MKELSIEQKAKAYDEALERAKEIDKVDMADSPHKEIAEYIFPVLKESEDERIRKVLINYFNHHKAGIHIFYGIKGDDVLDWLEKQGSETYSQKDAKCFNYDDGKRDEFKDAIQVGDHVTRNEEGVLVNLSELKRNLKKESPTTPKKVDLEKLQKIQLEHIGSLDIQIATRYDQNSTLFTMTDYPLTRELYVHKLPWGEDNSEEFKKINKELKMLLS